MGQKRKAKGPKAPKPEFNEAALSQLTSKLETTLSKPKDTKEPKDQSSAKRKRNDGDSKDANPKKRQAAEAKDGSRKPKKAPKESKTSLLEEIRLLGGDEADLDLVAGVDSDAEEGQEKPGKPNTDVDDALKNELASFAAGLGFEKIRDEDIVTDEEIEEIEAAEEVEEEEEEEESASEDEPEPAPKAAPPPAEKAEKAEKPSRKGAGKLVFEPRPDWHALDQENLPVPASDDFPKFSTTIASLKAYGKTLLDADAAAYNTTVASSSTHKFMSTIMTSGTMSDKVSALTLAIQESPVHNIKALESLITLAGKKSRGQAIAALGALVDLLGNGVVLPNDRRLRPFQAQPGLMGTLQEESVGSWKPEKALPGLLTKAHLIMWVYEDWLKDSYFKIIQLLEQWCGDEIEYSRSRSIDFVYGLLRDKPEQEANLLRLLVNKLGDRERKIASRASYLLLQLLNVHPGMKSIMINTMEQEVLLKPSQSLRAKYYAMNTLNQTILSGKEPQIADTLVRIYFELFASLLKTGSLGAIGYSSKSEDKPEGKPKGKRGYSMPEYKKKKGPAEKAGPVPDVETAEKLVTAILTGINRAVPFSKADDATLEKHLDTLFRITHSSNFNTSIQALMLIQQLSISKHLAVDRFYRTLYESLLDPRLVTSSKQALYLNLMFRSLKNDVDVRRVKAFVKRMLQVCYLHQPSFACGILFLITQLQETFPDLKTLLNEPEEDGDDEEVYRDAPAEGSTEEVGAKDSRPTKLAYDGRKRDPQYSHADQSCMWEVIPYFRHFHPSVSVFAENLLVKQKSVPKPELANHTLMHFLDKFVYRNAKATDSNRGGSIMQPGQAAGGAVQVVVPGKGGAKQQATLNSAAFWNLKQADVAAEDVFFHEYFSQIGKPGQEAKTKKVKDDAEGEDEEEAEEEIWEALVNSHPEIGGKDSDADMDMGSDDGSDLGSLLEMSSDDDDDDDLDSDVDVEGDAFEGSDAEAGADDDGWVDAGELGEDSDEAEVPAGKKSRAKGKMSKRDMKKLPTFATADDYAALLAQEDDEEGFDL